MTDWISFEALSWCSGIVVWDLGVRNGLGLDCRAIPSNLKGYPGVDESFSAETLQLEILLLQIENHASYGLSLGEGYSKRIQKCPFYYIQSRSIQIDSDMRLLAASYLTSLFRHSFLSISLTTQSNTFFLVIY